VHSLLRTTLSCAIAALALLGNSEATAGTNQWTSAGPGTGAVDDLRYSADGTELWMGSATAGAFRSTDEGGNWARVSSGIGEQAVVSLEQSSLDGTQWLAACPAQVLSCTAGTSPSWISQLDIADAEVFTVARWSRSQSSHLFAGAANGFYRSVDAGATWTHVTSGFGTNAILSIETNPHSSSEVWVGTYDGVFKSTDDGVTFSAMNLGLETMPHKIIRSILFDSTDSTRLYLGTWFGVYTSTNSGAHWSRETSVPEVYVSRMSGAATSGGGFAVAAATKEGVYSKGSSSWSQVRAGAARANSHHQTGYAQTLARLLETNRYDLLHCEWTPYAIYALDRRLATCIAAHNVEWDIWSRTAETERRRLHRWLFTAQTSLMRRFEQNVFSRFEHATAVSAADASRIGEMGCRHVTVVPNGVDASLYLPPATESAPPRSLVFSGSMDWRANQDAIRWFIDQVHPLLVAQGDYQFHIVGRSPPAWLQDSSRVPSQIVVTGAVDTVQPFIANASIYVVPLRVGGGSRLKILEALSMGRAVVSTTVGAEGLDLEPGIDIVIADSASDFAAAVTALWLDAPARQRLGRAGRARIERQYRWEQIAPLQAAAWTAAIAG